MNSLKLIIKIIGFIIVPIAAAFMIKSTLIVLAVVLVVGLVIFGIDTLLTEGISLLQGHADKKDAAAEVTTQAAAAINAADFFIG